MMKLTACQINAVRLIPSEFRISIRPLLVHLAEEQEGDDERVDRHCLGECDADDHVQQDGAAGLGIAADRLHSLASQDANADPRADSSESNGESYAEGQK